MKISKECKDYESHALKCRRKPSFPIEVPELLVYIRYRARSSLFCNYMSNLEKHPAHGYPWLNRMNNEPLIKKEMKHFIEFWNIKLSDYKKPLLGVSGEEDINHWKDADPVDRHAPTSKIKKKENGGKVSKKTVNAKTKIPKVIPKPSVAISNVQMVNGPKLKVGFMVTTGNATTSNVHTPKVEYSESGTKDSVKDSNIGASKIKPSNSAKPASTKPANIKPPVVKLEDKPVNTKQLIAKPADKPKTSNVISLEVIDLSEEDSNTQTLNSGASSSNTRAITNYFNPQSSKSKSLPSSGTTTKAPTSKTAAHSSSSKMTTKPSPSKTTTKASTSKPVTKASTSGITALKPTPKEVPRKVTKPTKFVTKATTSKSNATTPKSKATTSKSIAETKLPKRTTTTTHSSNLQFMEPVIIIRDNSKHKSSESTTATNESLPPTPPIESSASKRIPVVLAAPDDDDTEIDYFDIDFDNYGDFDDSLIVGSKQQQPEDDDMDMELNLEDEEEQSSFTENDWNMDIEDEVDEDMEAVLDIMKYINADEEEDEMEDAADELMELYDIEFNEDVYLAYLAQKGRKAAKNKGKKKMDSVLMVLSHIAIERSFR